MSYTLTPQERDLRVRANSYLETLQSIRERIAKEGRNFTVKEKKDVEGLLEKLDATQDEIETLNAIGKRESHWNGSAPWQKRPNVPSGYGGGDDGDGSQFRNLGDFCSSVVSASVPGGGFDPRLQTRALAGMGEGVGSSGGFMVDAPVADGLLQKVFSSGEIAKRLNRIPLTMPNSNGIRIPYVDETSRVTGSRLGGVRTY